MREAEVRFPEQAGIVAGAMRYLDQGVHQQFVVQLISQETVESSAIEGEVLERGKYVIIVCPANGFRYRSAALHPG